MSRLLIETKERKFDTAEDLYGIFFEDINRAGDGGLYPEMLRNRAFEDSLLPDGYAEKEDGVHVVTRSGWEDEFNHGEGLRRWIAKNRTEETPVPAWYVSGARMELELEQTLNANRSAALRVRFEQGGCLYNTGFQGIPQKRGESCSLLLFAAVKEPVRLEVSVEEGERRCAEAALFLSGEGFVRYDAVLPARENSAGARFCLRCPEGGEVLFGFISLMPSQTYMGHGLRRDLVEKLRELHPAFMRFPGGCIVEGTTPSTVMRFRNTVGPVWERPGQLLVWHYKSTLGLGFHEYLQLCEDLDMEPLYVCNCGMTCQGRKCVLLTGMELEETLQDTLDALEYALGPADSEWGSVRAAMGHPGPFRMTYLEIGNENWGPDYEERYLKFYQEIRKRYPHIRIVANAHVEKHGCPAEYVDEHFYSTMEFFAENLDYYGGYDRKGPKIFVGEQAVNEGTFMGKLYGALGEAMFLIGLERNQDIVALASYAPLFENIHYSSWFPNLIRFNNRESFGIPTYYVWKMFGQNRGKRVLKTTESAGKIYRPFRGMASLQAKQGILFRNARWNGEPVGAMREISEVEGESFVIFGDEDQTRGRFEVEILAEEGARFAVGAFSARAVLSYFDQLLRGAERIWSAFGVRPILWKIEGNRCYAEETAFPENRRLTEDFTVDLTSGEYHRFGYETDGHILRLLLDGACVRELELPHSPSFASVTTETDEDILIKAVNLAGETDELAITLDTEVESGYTAAVLAGEKDAENSFAEPERVCDRTVRLAGAGKEFVYAMPPYSVSVLRLRKKEKMR